MLTAVICLVCVLLFQLILYCLQGVVFAFRGLIKGDSYYRKRFLKKLVGIALVIFLILLFNEVSKYVN